MNKPVHLTDLEKVIKTTGIYDSLEDLKGKLNAYGKSKAIRDYRYEIQKETEDIYRTIAVLKDQITELINKQSEQWEAPE